MCVKASRHAYAKFLYTSLRRLGIVPQFDHGHRHRLIEYDIHAIYLETVVYKSQLQTGTFGIFLFKEQLKALPVQAEQGLTTYVSRHGCC